MDKVMQIFDPRYYQDRDTALKGLFTEVQLIAGSRGPLGEKELKEFLSKKENQVYEDRVYPLTLSEGLKDLTSTDLRTRIANGNHRYVPKNLSDTMLDLLYTGHPDLAWEFVEMAWPPDIAGKDKFLSIFRTHLKESRYWPLDSKRAYFVP